MVCFDVIFVFKGSRVRWRVTKVWKENEFIEDLIEKVVIRLQLFIDGIFYKEFFSFIVNIDEEMRRIISELNDSSIIVVFISVGGIKYVFVDVVLSGTGVVLVWNFKYVEFEGMKDVDDLDLSDENEFFNLSMVVERYYMNRFVLGDSLREEKFLVNGYIDESVLVLVNDEKL